MLTGLLCYLESLQGFFFLALRGALVYANDESGGGQLEGSTPRRQQAGATSWGQSCPCSPFSRQCLNSASYGNLILNVGYVSNKILYCVDPTEPKCGLLVGAGLSRNSFLIFTVENSVFPAPPAPSRPPCESAGVNPFLSQFSPFVE